MITPSPFYPMELQYKMVTLKRRRIRLHRGNTANMMRQLLMSREKTWMVLKFTGNFFSYIFKCCIRRARQQISEHGSPARKWGIATLQKFLPNITNVFGHRSISFQDFSFQRPHYPLFGAHYECQVVLGWLCGRTFHRFTLERPMLNIERLIT